MQRVCCVATAHHACRHCTAGHRTLVCFGAIALADVLWHRLPRDAPELALPSVKVEPLAERGLKHVSRQARGYVIEHSTVLARPFVFCSHVKICLT